MISSETKDRDRDDVRDDVSRNAHDGGHDRAVVAPAVPARQGLISGRVLTVLTISLSLAVIALFVAYFIFR